MNIIEELNFEATLGRQNNECKECGDPLEKNDTTYFRMNQTINLYEVYCYNCGLVQAEIDKANGKTIDGDPND